MYRIMFIIAYGMLNIYGHCADSTSDLKFEPILNSRMDPRMNSKFLNDSVLRTD